MNIKIFEDNKLFGIKDSNDKVLIDAKYSGLRMVNNCCILIQNSSGTFKPSNGVYILKNDKFDLTNYEGEFDLLLSGFFAKVLSDKSEWDVYKVFRDEEGFKNVEFLFSFPSNVQFNFILWKEFEATVTNFGKIKYASWNSASGFSLYNLETKQFILKDHDTITKAEYQSFQGDFLTLLNPSSSIINIVKNGSLVFPKETTFVNELYGNGKKYYSAQCDNQTALYQSSTNEFKIPFGDYAIQTELFVVGDSSKTFFTKIYDSNAGQLLDPDFNFVRHFDDYRVCDSVSFFNYKDKHEIFLDITKPPIYTTDKTIYGMDGIVFDQFIFIVYLEGDENLILDFNDGKTNQKALFAENISRETQHTVDSLTLMAFDKQRKPLFFEKKDDTVKEVKLNKVVTFSDMQFIFRYSCLTEKEIDHYLTLVKQYWMHSLGGTNYDSEYDCKAMLASIIMGQLLTKKQMKKYIDLALSVYKIKFPANTIPTIDLIAKKYPRKELKSLVKEFKKPFLESNVLDLWNH